MSNKQGSVSITVLSKKNFSWNRVWQKLPFVSYIPLLVSILDGWIMVVYKIIKKRLYCREFSTNQKLQTYKIMLNILKCECWFPDSSVTENYDTIPSYLKKIIENWCDLSYKGRNLKKDFTFLCKTISTFLISRKCLYDS